MAWGLRHRGFLMQKGVAGNWHAAGKATPADTDDLDDALRAEARRQFDDMAQFVVNVLICIIIQETQFIGSPMRDPTVLS